MQMTLVIDKHLLCRQTTAYAAKTGNKILNWKTLNLKNVSESSRSCWLMSNISQKYVTEF